jgi:hypothetical protein
MRMFPYLVLICLSAGACSSAQNTESGKAGGMPALAPKRADVAALEFSKPKIVEDLGAGPMIVGRLDCSDDGSIYTLIDGYALNSGSTALLAIHPDGTVTSLLWRSVPGFAHISPPKSIFVGNGRVYVLVSGESDSAKQGNISRYPLVLAFDKQGSIVGTVVLKQDLNSLVLGVFPSGNILLISEDRLNHRMALNLVGADGAPIRELRLYDSDFVVRAAQMPTASRGPASYSTYLLITMSKFFPSGDNLLLVPLETSGLPMVELDERGVLHSVVPHLPDDMILEGFVSSNASSWKVRLANAIENDKEPLDLQGKVLGVATRPSARIAELSRTDGSLLRELDMGGPGVQPACETDGTFRFLTSGAGQGRLQVVTARVR